jgi:hypothetical protein
MLQSQEQAWLAMAGTSSSVLENLPPAAPGSPAAAPAHGAQAGEGLTDEEVARLLQEEEEREFQQRMLALAGIGPAAAGAGAEGAPADGGAEFASEDEVDPDNLSYEEVRGRRRKAVLHCAGIELLQAIRGAAGCHVASKSPRAAVPPPRLCS